jgi:hypothetical protein
MTTEQQLEEMTDDQLRALEQQERGRAGQEIADNSIAPQRLTRHQLIAAVRKANPDMRYGSDLFRECLVMNALNQEGGNLAKLANFLGMSKGEVRNHILKINKKIEAARAEARTHVENAVEKAIEKYESTTKTVEAATADRQGVGNPDDSSEAPATRDVRHGNVPPIGT